MRVIVLVKATEDSEKGLFPHARGDDGDGGDGQI
jgi:hypothetical protein